MAVTDAPMSWRALLHTVTVRFERGGVACAEVDARRVVEQASGYEGAELALHLGESATSRSMVAVEQMTCRRLAGEPLQYVLGAWGFRSLDLMVDRRVLIPRPETESVVGRALVALDSIAEQVVERPLLAADLGTGSGAIALSLVAERPSVEVVATDTSPDALAVARANLAGLGRPASRVSLRQGHWFAALPTGMRRTFHLVVSNPPYVAETDHLPPEVVDWEPRQALVAGPSGIEALEAIIGEAGDWLVDAGALVVELAPHQADALAGFAEQAGFGAVDVFPDDLGRPRALVAGRPRR